MICIFVPPKTNPVETTYNVQVQSPMSCYGKMLEGLQAV